MIRLTVSKEAIEGPPPLPEGLYTVRCDGFKPAFSKDRNSKNLNPILKVTNHAEHNDRQLFENLNTKADWVWKDFCHCFGAPIETENGSYVFPGTFGDFPDDRPDLWQYTGPVLGQLGQVYLVQSEYQGNISHKVKFYVCKLALAGNCSLKHSQNLVK